MQPFFEKADIFCLPSIAEPSAAVLIEASGFGLPVVATRVGGSPERVLEGETGLLVEHSNVEALCGAIQFLIKNPEAARKMGIAGRERVLRDFTWSAVAAKILGQIRSIVPNSR
jgi:starch synthase